MKKEKILSVVLFSAAFACVSWAQDSYSSLKPSITAGASVSTGIENIDGNPEYEAVPGLSSDYSVDTSIDISGSFTRASEWAVEKENGIESKKGIGYEAGLSVDMAAIYNSAASSSSSYTESSNTNHYSLIQPMIDWYEANEAKYGLPYSPITACGKSWGSKWPTTSYGESSSRYQFIQGSLVERADDVNWDSQKWADAQCLYTDIKYAIQTAIKTLYSDVFSTGNIDQNDYASLSSENKRLAELKMKAISEFEKVAAGTTSSDSPLDAINSAYIAITNIGGLADVRLDFLGKRLTVGKDIYSYLAGQSESGSAATVSLKRGFVQGLEASVSLGLAGGEEQTAEDWDTSSLEYYSGMPGELALKGFARYNTFFENLGADFSAEFGAVASDLMASTGNFAVDAAASYKSHTAISYGSDLEAMLLNYKDREVDSASYQMAYSFAAKLYGGAYGANASLGCQYKSANFTHKQYTSSDRFYGYSLEGDFYTANAAQALKFAGEISFNPEYFISYDIFDVTAGGEGLLYNQFELYSYGAYLDLSFDMQDIVNVPVKLYSAFHFYQNTKLSVWDDMSSLPEQNFYDFTTIKAGISFKPVKVLELSLEYASSPSYSRRTDERISSLLVSGKMLFD